MTLGKSFVYPFKECNLFDSLQKGIAYLRCLVIILNQSLSHCFKRNLKKTIMKTLILFFFLILVFSCQKENKVEPKSALKEMTIFSFKQSSNSLLSMDIDGMIVGKDIKITLPPNTKISDLKAFFTSSLLSSVAVNGVKQESGITSNDFSKPIVYRITAEDGTFNDYTVTVTVAKLNEKTITTFAFTKTDNPLISTDISGTISGKNIDLILPLGIRPNAIRATFMVSPLATVKVNNVMQESGVTINDFNKPVIYQVTAEDGTTADFTITVKFTLSTDRALSSFTFLKTNNTSMSADLAATINNSQITVTFPVGTNVDVLKTLKATFKAPDFSIVTVANVLQVSGQSINDFSKVVTYRVTSQDSSITDYKVTSTILQSAEKQLLSFAFLKANNPFLTEDRVIDVSPNRPFYLVTLPVGTNISALKPTFTISPLAKITVNNVIQNSGLMSQDFSKGVINYRITAENGTTNDFGLELSVQVDLSTVEDAVKTFMNKYQVPGMSVAITKDERLVYAKGYGVADKDKGTPITNNSLFRIASVSKTITGITAMKLVDDGKLDLDRKVFGTGGILGITYGNKPYSQHLEQITVRHVLSMTAGGDAWNHVWDFGINRIDPFYQKEWLGYTQAQVISAVLDTRPVIEAPNTKYVYSNISLNIAGRIIEKVTGVGYEKYVQDNILKPIGIPITSMRIGGGTLAERYSNEVVYYNPYPGFDQPYDFPVPRFDAHGGWITTSISLARLLSYADGMTAKKDILSNATWREMITPTKVSVPTGGYSGYGLGWNASVNGAYWHSGGMAGTASYLLKIGSYTFTILINTRSNAAGFYSAIDKLCYQMSADLSLNTWMKGDQFDVYYK